MDDWIELERELGCWTDPSRPAMFWWRDDDASRESHSLERLLAVSAAYDVPLGLAVVPGTMTPAFSAALSRLDERVQVLQHGFEHRNHAGNGEKKTEFGEHRSMSVMGEEIARGAEMLHSAAGERCYAMFVPPWNRISEPVLSALPGLGFASVSTFGVRPSARPAPGLRQLNTHVDLIDWRDERRCAGVSRLVGALVDHLKAHRAGVDGEPTGVLSHHLVHDEACWDFLERLFSLTRASGNARWLRPSEAVSYA